MVRQAVNLALPVWLAGGHRLGANQLQAGCPQAAAQQHSVIALPLVQPLVCAREEGKTGWGKQEVVGVMPQGV